MTRFTRLGPLRRNLATRYLLMAAGFLTVILLLFSLLQIFRTYRQDLVELENKSAIQSSFLAAVSVEHILTNNFFVLERLARQIHTDPDVVYAVLVDNGGRALTRYIEVDNPIMAAAREKSEADDLLSLIDLVREMPLVEQRSVAIELEGSQIGQVHLGYTRQGVRDRLVTSAATTFVATVVVIALLSLLTFVIFRWLIGRRLQTVGMAVEGFAQGDFAARVPVNVADEIGRLSIAFNHMADQLEETLAGLQEANQEIEATNRALRVSEAEARKLSQVASRTSNLVIISDANGDIEWVNKAFCRVTGFLPEEVMGQRPGNLLQGPETDPAAVDYMRERLEAQQPFNCEVVNYARSGDLYWVNIDVQPVYDENDALINYIAVETDVTEQKRSEQALRERIQLVSMMSEVSAEFISCPTNEIDDRISAVLERVGRQLDVDYVALELFDPEREDTISAQSRWADESLRPYLSKVESSEVDRHSQWSHSLDAGQPIIASSIEKLEIPSRVLQRLIDASFQSMLILPIAWGRRRRGQLVIGLVFSEREWAEDIVSAVEVVADIFASTLQRREFDSALETERLALRQRTGDLRIANVALAEASLAKDAFWANMSHELRTPLNAILGYAQLMGRDDTLSKQQMDHLNVVESSANHLLDLINDVLSLSKATAGRMNLAPANFDLFALLKTLEHMFRPRMDKKQLQFTVVKAPDLPRFVRADDGKLRQVLLNLLENALKFTDVGIVSLRVGYKHATSRFSFAVEDTGMGISADELDQLFELFGQTTSGRQSGTGTGLGLALSRQFVDLMGGDLQVASQEGKGSTFSFEIEAELVQHTPESHIKGERHILSLAQGQPSYRILVAEDMETNRNLMAEILTGTGFTVRFANNGREALVAVEEWKPDLILMDLRMPQMDGYEATRRLRQDDRFANLPIIAVTASVLDSQQHLAYTAGCTDVVYKPIQIEELLLTMARYLDVEFRYGEVSAPAPSHENPPAAVSLLAFERLPAGLVRRIHDAATLLDANALAALSQEAARYHMATSDILNRLIEDFEFEPIIEASTDEAGADAHH